MKKKNQKLKLNRETISKMGMKNTLGGGISDVNSGCLISGSCGTSCCPTLALGAPTCHGSSCKAKTGCHWM
ncbi:MAG TPA: hypothetical protein PLU17_09185 [Chitinophagaceae bacterium]|nr:hypothetical protein [Chitinophagaceae bacterium]